MNRMDASTLTAIDVHVHLEHMGKATAADDQAQKYFGATAERDWSALADYYRSRKMACVVFTVHEKLTGRPEVPNDEVAKFGGRRRAGTGRRDRCAGSRLRDGPDFSESIDLSHDCRVER